MIEKLRIPQLSANVEEATVTAWLKKEGEPVRKGDPVVELTTEKACFECDSPVDGVVRALIAEEKSVLPVGYVIALIGDADDELPEVGAENQKVIDDATRHKPRRRRRREGGPREATGKRVRATPAARRAARELGLDLAAIPEASRDGPVTETMVRAFAKGRDESC